MNTRRNPTRHLKRDAKFDFSVLEELECADRKTYADKCLPFIGNGTSRRVYVLSSKKVLKLAYSSHNGECELGAVQNEVEATVSRDAAVRKSVTRVYRVGPEYEYIVSERAVVSQFEFA